MAYTPTEWSCGEAITAEKLNKLERGVEDMAESYEPTNWQCGDIITAEKLNKLEQAVANGGGGECDFSTAEVTVTNNTIDYVGATAPFSTIYGAMGEQACSIGTNNFTVIVDANKGTVLHFAYPGYDIQVTGSGSVEIEGTDCFITGDCTITIS